MSRRSSADLSVVDRPSIGLGVVLGALAYVLGYLVIWVFNEIETEDSLSAALEYYGSSGFPIEVYHLVGMVFYNAHFVDTEGTAEDGSRSVTRSTNFIDGGTSTIPEPFWYLVPIVVLVVVGYLAVRIMHLRIAEPRDAVVGGAVVTAGYAPLAALGTFLFSVSGTVSAQRGLRRASVDVTMGPNR